jgi:hypothetical protein
MLGGATLRLNKTESKNTNVSLFQKFYVIPSQDEFDPFISSNICDVIRNNKYEYLLRISSIHPINNILPHQTLINPNTYCIY